MNMTVSQSVGYTYPYPQSQYAFLSLLLFSWTHETSSVAARVHVPIQSPLLAKHGQNVIFLLDFWIIGENNLHVFVQQRYLFFFLSLMIGYKDLRSLSDSTGYSCFLLL